LQLLGNTTMKIEEVAAHLAYTDAGGFVRAFRRWQGCSPSEYRWDLPG
jgi:AraC-like DNA-binding protein